MKTVEQIKKELKKQNYELIKNQHMIDVVAKNDLDKHKAEIQYFITAHVIKSLEWVLSES